MKARNRNNIIANNTNEVKWWGWATLATVALFLVLAPYHMAFFNGEGLHGYNQFIFEKEHYYGILISIIGILIMSFLTFANKERINGKFLIALFGGIIPILYWVSSWSAESPYLAKLEWYNSIAVYSFFLMGVILSESTRLQKYLIYIYFFIGSIVVIYGFSYLFGNNYKLDALQYIEGVRLASVFTYPNAYAAFLMTLLIICLMEITGRLRNRYVAMGYSFMLVPIVISILLTLSRGAIIMLPLIALITLVFLTLKRQIEMTFLLISAFVLSIIVQGSFSKRGTAVYQDIQNSISSNTDINKTNFFSWESSRYWLIILGLSLVMTALVYLYYRLIDKRVGNKISNWTKKRYSRFVIPSLYVGSVILGAIIVKTGILDSILPEQLANRLQGITYRTHSVLERLIFYKNAMEMWKAHPVLGGGGGTWEALYQQYQPYAYNSSQVHSYPIQVLLSIGLIGFVALGSFVVFIGYKFVKTYITNSNTEQQEGLIFFLIATSIIFHSFIDFEMSYMFFSGIVFLCLGAISVKSNGPLLNKMREKSHRRIKWGVAAAWLVVALIVCVGTFSGLQANGNYEKARVMAREGKPFPDILNTINSGLQLKPGNPFLLELLSSYYAQAYEQSNDKNYANEAFKTINELIETEPHFNGANVEKYTLESKLGNSESAIQAIDQAIKNAPQQISFYEMAMKERFVMWTKYNSLGDEQKKEKFGKEIIQIYQKALDNIENLKNVPKEINYDKSFVISDQMQTIYNQVK